MPDAAGNIKGIVLSGKAGETLARILKADPWRCIDCGGLRTPADPNCLEDKRKGHRCTCAIADWQPSPEA